MRYALVAALLAVAATLIAAGATILHPAAGLIVAGVLLAGWTWLVVGPGQPGNQ